MDKDKLERYLERYGWNGKFFLLTRDHAVEITETGDGDYDKKGTLFFYTNQVGRHHPSEEVDEFGRNYLDQVFIALCIQVQCLVVFPTEPKIFKSLTTRKERDKYLVRLQYDDVDLEMEVEEMYRHLTKSVEESREGG